MSHVQEDDGRLASVLKMHSSHCAGRGHDSFGRLAKSTPSFPTKSALSRSIAWYDDREMYVCGV